MTPVDLRKIPQLPFRAADLLLQAIRFAMMLIPYVWGKDDPAVGLDCSGFVAALVYQLSGNTVDIRATHNTTVLWEQLDYVENAHAQAGDLAFYGPHSDRPVSHVMVYVGSGIVVGQAYGGPENTDPVKSRETGRVTKCLPLLYRQDFVGFRRLRLAPPKELFT